MMEADLRTLLLADTGVAGASGGRVTWGERPQGSALPALVLHIIGSVPGYTLEGDGHQRESRVQADCYAPTFLDARTLATAVSGCLSGYSGIVGTTRFQGIFQDSEQDLSEDAAAGGRVFRMSLDFIIRHHPTI